MITSRSLNRFRALVVFLAFVPFQPSIAKPPELPPLTTESGDPRIPGKFVWADLVTDDVAAARKFYGGLFGWTFTEVGDYTIAANDERPLCGMFQRVRPPDRPEAKPRWFGFISVRNVKDAQKAVIDAGGKVLAAPKKMPRRGEQAIFADKEGAVFGVIKSSGGDPRDFLADPGDWIWIQLFSNDASKAADFYQQVAGYDVIENSETNRMSDYLLASGGYARAAVRSIREQSKKPPPAWLLFVRVESISDSVAKAKQLGGKVLLEPKPELFNGKVAIVADPTGAAVGILEWDQSQMKGGN